MTPERLKLYEKTYDKGINFDDPKYLEWVNINHGPAMDISSDESPRSTTKRRLKFK